MDPCDVKRLEKIICEKGGMFDILLENKTKKYFDSVLYISWRKLGKSQMLTILEKNYDVGICSDFKTSVDTPNRERDRKRIEKEYNLKEIGNDKTIFYDSNGNNVAKGYNRVCYGDHGPYIEFGQNQVNWDIFRIHKLKGPERHYHEHYTIDKKVKLYNQFRGVEDEPNPPPGKYSFSNNRSEGYADYKIGVVYVDPDQLKYLKNE